MILHLMHKINNPKGMVVLQRGCFLSFFSTGGMPSPLNSSPGYDLLNHCNPSGHFVRGKWKEENKGILVFSKCRRLSWEGSFIGEHHNRILWRSQDQIKHHRFTCSIIVLIVQWHCINSVFLLFSLCGAALNGRTKRTLNVPLYISRQ